VYNHSTTQAQVLTTVYTTIHQDEIAFSSMSKDAGIGSDWATADASAGRLVSGTVATPLAAGDVVKVYANGTLLGNATVDSSGTAWAITDPNGYNSNWVYSANIVSASGTSPTASQVVTLDNTAGVAPVITGVDVALTAQSIAPSAYNYATGGGVQDNNFLIRELGIEPAGTLGLDGTPPKDHFYMYSYAQQQQGWASTEVIRITPRVAGDYIERIQFTYADIQFANKAIRFIAEDGSVIQTNTLFANGGTNAFDSGVLPQKAAYFEIYGGNQDYFRVFGITATTYTPAEANSISGTGTPGSMIYVYDNSQTHLVGSAVVDASGNWTLSNPTNVVNGNTVFAAREMDAAGNLSPYSNLYTARVGTSVTTPAADGTLVSGAGSSVGTGGVDNVTYAGGAFGTQGGDDVITAGSAAVPSVLAAGGSINGGSGVDTLKLAAGTTLNLASLTVNQTVKSIQEVEVFQMQGTSTLSLTANDVLSLGGTNATTMAAYSFVSGGTVTTSSAGKVQMVVLGTAGDTLNLSLLKSDAVTTNGTLGNAGLGGQWVDKGTVTIGSDTFSVYDHSTTKAQVLVKGVGTVNTPNSPLVLDLNGDGVQTLNLDLGTQFDLLNSGAKQSVGWVDKHDGLLVMDLNQDGMVNNGSELLGTSTQLADGSLARDGWQALAQYDGNVDGVIDAKDAAFADLTVWVDANSDGVTEAGELKTLTDVGVQAIQLQHDNAQTEQNGNVLQGYSSFTTTDGQSHQIVDAWLQTSTSAAGAATFNLGNAKADTLDLNLSDVLKTAANTAGQHVVQVTGDANDTVNLSSLLDTGAAPGSWQASGAVVQGGVTYNVYSHSADASLQVLIDQHITQVHVG
jgi:hypothetical protein